MIKDDYREDTNLDVYNDNSQGSYSDDYVKWLETKLQLLQSRVVGQSEQLCGFFEASTKTSSDTTCIHCSREKWLHPKAT